MQIPLPYGWKTVQKTYLQIFEETPYLHVADSVSDRFPFAALRGIAPSELVGGTAVACSGAGAPFRPGGPARSGIVSFVQRLPTKNTNSFHLNSHRVHLQNGIRRGGVAEVKWTPVSLKCDLLCARERIYKGEKSCTRSLICQREICSGAL